MCETRALILNVLKAHVNLERKSSFSGGDFL